MRTFDNGSTIMRYIDDEKTYLEGDLRSQTGMEFYDGTATGTIVVIYVCNGNNDAGTGVFTNEKCYIL